DTRTQGPSEPDPVRVLTDVHVRHDRAGVVVVCCGGRGPEATASVAGLHRDVADCGLASVGAHDARLEVGVVRLRPGGEGAGVSPRRLGDVADVPGRDVAVDVPL